MQNDAFVYARPRKLLVYRLMTFGEWLRKKLPESNISNAELARRVGVSPTHIGNLIRDYSPNKRTPGPSRPSEDVVEAIAKALNQPVDEARRAAGYSSDDDGLFSGLEKLSPERQKLAKQTIRALIDSLAAQDELDTDDT